MIAKRIKAVCALAFVTSLTMQAARAADSDEAVIRQQAADFAKAFAAGDGKAVAAQWSPDGTFIDEGGNVHKGRAEIEAIYRKLFAEHGAAPITVNVESITFPSPGVAVEIGTTCLVGDKTASRYSAVHVKQDSGWTMCTVTETPEFLAAADNIKDLSWLTGSWTAHGAKGAMNMKARWDTNHNFIYCTFGGGDTLDGSQIFGFDAAQGHICSWHFDRDGRLGRTIWSHEGANWLGRGSSLEPDGRHASSLYIVHPVDDKSYTWRSIDRTIEGQPLPDSTEVTVTRDN